MHPDNLLGACCFLSIVLVFVTLLGHGLWLALAACFRLLSDSATPDQGSSSRPPGPRCPACGLLVSSTTRPCPRCGHVPAARPSSAEDDRAAAIRELNRLCKAGAISAARHAELVKLLRASPAELLNLLRASPEEGDGIPAIPPAAHAQTVANAPQAAAAPRPAPQREVRPEPIEAELVTETPCRREKAAPMPPPPPPPPPRPLQPVAAKPHPLDADAPLPAATTAARQTLADFLQAFMAEKNIRWGELVSGLLIVGSAVGLVISLRETLKDTIPYFPALLFLLVTLAIYGAGMYTLQRWNLRATSRGVLTISLLLAPLNFLAAIILSEGEKRAVTDPWYLVAVAVGTLCCGWITYSAGRALLGRGWWRLTAAVLATSGGQLLIDRQSVLGGTLLGTSVLVALPVGGYLVAVLSQLQHAIAWRRLSERRSVQILLILGVSTFALLAPLGLFIAHRDSVVESLANLAPTLSLVAAAVLGTGLALHGRVLSRALVGYRTAGTALAVAGGMLMAATVVLAWPKPDLLITVGLANAAILVVVASIGRLPLLHTVACGCLALAYLVAFHVLQGTWNGAEAHPSQRWIELFLMGRSGIALTVLAAAIGGVAWGLGLRQRWLEAENYWLGAAGLAIVTIVIAVCAGSGASQDQDLATPIFALYAAVALLAAVWLCSRDHKFSGAAPAITSVGIGLTLAALGHAFWLNETCRGWLADLHLLPSRPVLTATLCTANFAAWWGLFLARQDLGVERTQRPQRRWGGLIHPLIGAALLLATLAAPSALWVREQAFGTHAIFLLAIAAVWLIATVLDRQPWALLVFQAVATVAVGFVTATACRVSDDEYWLASSAHLQTQIAVLAAWCLAWSGLRRLRYAGYADRVPGSALIGLRPAYRTVDEVLLGGLLCAAGAHGIAACWPGTLAELGLAKFSADAVPQFVCGPAAWIAWALLLAALVAALWEQFSLLPVRRGRTRSAPPGDGALGEDWSLLAALVGVWLALATLPLLVSAPWTSVCATASALRWSFALYGVVMSAVIWFRRSIGARIAAWAGVADGGRPFESPACPAGGLLVPLPASDFPAIPAGASLHSAASQPIASGRLAGDRRAPPPGTTARILRETGLWIGILPALVLTTIMVVRAVEGLPRGTPTDALFGSLVQTNLGKMVSFGVPLMIVVGVLLGHAMREGLLGYALLSSVIFQYSLTLAHALNTKPNEPSFAAESLQWNATGLAVFTLLWLSLHRWLRPREEERRAEAAKAVAGAAEASPLRAAEIPLLVQITATMLAVAALAGWSATAVFLTPGGLTDYEQPLGGLLSYGAWGLTLGAAVWLVRRHPLRAEARPAAAHEPDLPQVLAGFALALVALLAATVDRWDVSRTWLAYHVLTLGWLGLTAGLVGLACRRLNLWREANLVGVAVVVLAVRGCLHDPHSWAPWWSIAAAAGSAVLTAVTAFRRRQQSFAYATVVLTVLATSFYWFGPWLGRGGRVLMDQAVLDLWMADLTAAVLAAGWWLGVEVWFQRNAAEQAFDPKLRSGRVHAAVPLLALVLSTLTMLLLFVCNIFDGARTLVLGPGEGIPVLLGLGVLLAGAFWDRRAVHAVPGLYLWGVLVVTWVLDRLGLPAEKAFYAVGLATAAYVTVTSLIWKQGARWVPVGTRWGVVDPLAGLQRTARWLPVVNLLGSGLALLITLIVVLNFEQRWMRISSGFAPAMLAVGVGALAQKERRALFQYVALLLTGAAAVYLSWADLAPSGESATWLLRVIRLLIVLSAMTFLYSVIVRRQLGADSPWLESVRRITATFGAGALVTLVLVLLIEFSIFHAERGVPIDAAHSGAVMVVLVGLILGLLSMALWPGRDPLALSEEGRMLYVYGAELVATLLFVHIYFCLPWLFHGRFRQYWPYIIMVIAFAGVGVGELFQRRGLRVLSEPLTRTGGFLPLLSALGWWVIVAEKTDYSALLFLVGLLYLVLCYYRRSIVSGVAAALAGNGALWRLLYQTDFAFWQHPQLWLIPPAVSVLIAGQMNRRRLPPAQLAGMRYASILVIYLSSTSEMFIRGIGESLWPPMILASLSVAGVFLGLVLQVRAFLYLGSNFVFLSMVSMVWHAQRAIQHSWPWWAFGIGLGIGILAVFGMFEKKRSEVTTWIEKLRHWEQ